MQPAGRLFGRMKLPANVVSPEDLALRAWPRAVGKRIAGRTRAIALVRETLVVEVEDVTWQRQLNTLRQQILTNLQKAVGIGIIMDIDFRPMGARRAAQRAEVSSSRPSSTDEAGAIADPILRRLYIASRKKASA